MTKTIKIVLIGLGFMVLLLIKIVLQENGSQGGMIWAILLFGYLAFTRAIWKHEKKSDSENKLDKNIK